MDKYLKHTKKINESEHVSAGKAQNNSEFYIPIGRDENVTGSMFNVNGLHSCPPPATPRKTTLPTFETMNSESGYLPIYLSYTCVLI